MPSTRYNGFAITCDACGTVTRAATLLVAQQKDLEHQARCAARAKREADQAAAANAQLGLFGGGT